MSTSFLTLSLLLIGTVSANIVGWKPADHTHKDDILQDINSGEKSDEHLYIHLIPHTHDDVGWLKTVDMYYTGSNDIV